MSPDRGDMHQAAVLFPPPPPMDVQRIAGPWTRMCPSRLYPVGLPTSIASASRATSGGDEGQGWPGRQLPSISLAAMPDSLIRGPSAHQIGPSPSHTLVGVQSKVWPAGTMIAAARNNSMLPKCRDGRTMASWSSIRGDHMKVLIASAALALASFVPMSLAPAGGQVCAQGRCCKTCSAGKACGDSCIAKSSTCKKGRGCACDG